MYELKKILLLSSKIFMVLLLGNIFSGNAKADTEVFKIIKEGNIKKTMSKIKEASKIQDENLVKIQDQIGKVGYELMGEQIKEKNSYFFSPLSLYVALSSFRPGTTDKSYEELSRKLIPEGMSEDDFNDVLGEIIFKISNKEDFGLKNKTLVAIDSKNEFSEDYIEKSSALGADLIEMDFLKNSKAATESLNKWVAKETNELINPLFNTPLSNDTLLILINTLYFKDDWKYTFEANNTEKDKFYTKNKEIEKDFMFQTSTYKYGENKRFQYISMDYKNGANMEIYLPKDKLEPKDILEEVIISQNYGKNTRNIKNTKSSSGDISLNVEEYKVRLTLPKFTQEDEISLNELLKKSGISQMFKRDGTSGLEKFFKKIDEKVWVDQVFQKTKVIVDEEGTEAAAATGIMALGILSEPIEKPKIMTINRPFIYQIKYEGVLLFMGVYDGE